MEGNIYKDTEPGARELEQEDKALACGQCGLNTRIM